MKHFSNLTNMVVFAAFFLILGALLASALIFWVYLDFKFLSLMAFAVFLTLVSIAYNLSNIKFKDQITEIVFLSIHVIFSIGLFYVSSKITKYLFESSVSQPSYAVLGIICFIFVCYTIISSYSLISQLHAKLKNLKFILKSQVTYFS